VLSVTIFVNITELKSEDCAIFIYSCISVNERKAFKRKVYNSKWDFDYLFEFVFHSNSRPTSFPTVPHVQNVKRSASEG
jgi:hypothetical protein